MKYRNIGGTIPESSLPYLLLPSPTSLHLKCLFPRLVLLVPCVGWLEGAGEDLRESSPSHPLSLVHCEALPCLPPPLQIRSLLALCCFLSSTITTSACCNAGRLQRLHQEAVQPRRGVCRTATFFESRPCRPKCVPTLCSQVGWFVSRPIPLIRASAHPRPRQSPDDMVTGRLPAPTSPTRSRAPHPVQLVARIETQLRLRDGWMAEIEAVRSNELLDQAAARPIRPPRPPRYCALLQGRSQPAQPAAARPIRPLPSRKQQMFKIRARTSQPRHCDGCRGSPGTQFWSRPKCSKRSVMTRCFSWICKRFTRRARRAAGTFVPAVKTKISTLLRLRLLYFIWISAL